MDEDEVAAEADARQQRKAEIRQMRQNVPWSVVILRDQPDRRECEGKAD